MQPDKSQKLKQIWRHFLSYEKTFLGNLFLIFVSFGFLLRLHAETIELSNIPASGVSSAPVMQASDAFSFTTSLQGSRLLSVEYYKIVGQKTIVVFSDKNGAPGSILAVSDPLDNIYPTGYGNWNRQVYIFSVKPELKSHSKYWIRGEASGGEILCGGASSNNEQGWLIGATGFRSAASDVTTIALFRVKAEIAPPAVVIVSQPTNITTDISRDVSFSVSATNALTYQWFKDGNALHSATNSILSLTNARPALIGDYFAVASNAYGTATSSVASLKINGVDSGIWKGLVAYYPFNGNANDASGNGNHGIANTVEWQSSNNENNGNSVHLTGGATVRVQHSASLSFPKLKPFAISLWVNPSSTYGHILGKRSAVQNCNYQIIFDNGKLFFHGDPFYQEFGSGDLLQMNKWSHILCTWDGFTSRIFIDGRLSATGTGANNNPLGTENTADLLIGGSATYARYSGAIDNLRIYNRALSDGEVKVLYDYESTPPQNNLNPRTSTATTQVVNGFVVGATITDGGYGYVENSIVTITGGGGTGAKAIATQFNGVVTSITITNPGSGYTSTPTITIAPPPFPPRKATATSQVVNGFVVGAKITDGGFGYDSPPAVLLVGGGGSGATAVATIENGVVTAINIISPGSGYTSAPHIRIASPPFSPKLSIDVTRVRVSLEVVLGRKYQIESSTDLQVWLKAGDAFIAQDEVLQQDFDVDISGRYFRINQVP